MIFIMCLPKLRSLNFIKMLEKKKVVKLRLVTIYTKKLTSNKKKLYEKNKQTECNFAAVGPLYCSCEFGDFS